MDDPTMRRLLESSHTIAVVGLSDKPERDSHEVARYLIAAGYRVIPVNPMVSEVLGLRSYPSLSAIPEEIPIDIVDIFRRSSEVEPVVREALGRHPHAVWMQLGVENTAAAALARSNGVQVLENLCIM
ncbi:MAG TPA: CoA-binding protein, partial [Thermoplasmata archaeon]|nr:CoA-binding protein [Thermoplasmata archaeon]